MVFLCLKTKAVAAFLDVKKIKQIEEQHAEYRSLKTRCHDHDQYVRNISTTTAAWPRRALWVRSVC